MRPLFSRGAAAILLVGWTLLIWWLCGTSEPLRLPRGPVVRYLQELAHAPLFGVHAVLVTAVLSPRLVRVGRGPRGSAESRWPWWAGVALAIAYGVCLEWWQGRVPGRAASARDVFTDAVGAAGLCWIAASGRLFGPRTGVVVVVSAVAAALAYVES